MSAASESSSRHSLYLKLAMLEIERERRAKEHVGSAARVARLTQRMEQIDGEVEALKKLMANEDNAPPEGPADAIDELEHSPPHLPRRTRVFRF